MSHQLVKKSSTGGYENIMPKSWIEAIKDKNTGQTLVEILQGFNMYFLSYTGDTAVTRCLVPESLRKKGLWITYVKYDGNVYTEWYAANEIDDKSWGDSSNWRVGNNTLVGDITISANGNWVINGTETEFRAVGEKGNTPLLRVSNNKLLVSYNLGVDYIDVTDNAVYTKFRVSGNKLQSSTDLGNTWTDVSDYIASQFRWLADSLANNIGRILMSRDEGRTWTDLSNNFTNNLHISKYIGANEALPTSGIAEGTIYAKGPTYAVEDTSNSNPIYRLWVYAWKGNTLAWQDNGEFTSIAAGVVQETGSNENVVMSQKAITEAIHGILYDVSANNDGATFDSLSALLSSENLSTLIPTAVRCGGMSIRFVLSSDNKYVQYRFILSTFTTEQFANISNWQREDVRILSNSFFIGDKKTNIKQDTREVVDGGRNFDIGIEIGEDNKYIYTGGYIDTNNNYAISKPFVLKSGDTLNISNIESLGNSIAVLSQKKDDTKYYPVQFGNSDTSYSIAIICDGEYYLCYKKTSTPLVSVIHNSDTLLSNLVSSVKEINSVVRGELTIHIIQGGRFAQYISVYGIVEENKNYIISRPFYFHKGDHIKLTNLTSTSSVSVLSLFKNDAYINKLTGDSSITTYELDIDEDGLYYISYNFSTLPQIEIKEYLEVIKKQKEFEEILFGDSSSFAHTVVAGQAGKFIYGKGWVDTNDNYTISEPIPVKVGDILTVRGIKKNSDTVVLISSQIGNSTTRYNVVEKGTIEQTEYTIKNYTDRNIVLTYTPSYGLPQVTIIRYNSKGADNRCQLRELYRCFSSCICVGDSVTHGVIDDYPNAYAEEVPSRSYPTQLAKITGWNVTNAGKGGITAKGWFSTKFNNYTYTNYQVCLIEMCYNQLYTDTLETDVVPYDDYNDYADTETGNLCKIIKGILTQNPNILIVMILSPRIVGNEYIPSYEVYKKIASYYNLPLIDLTKGEITDLNAECYHGTDSDGVLGLTHFNALGYMAKADVIAQMFNEAMLAVPRKSNNAIYG